MLKFPGQRYVQTWHGDRGFKRVLFDMGTNEAFPDGAQMDLAVSGSDFGSRVYRSSLRYGGEVGTHEIIIAAAGETVTLKHEAENRSLFAQGALAAAAFIAGKAPGMYDMRSIIE